MSQKKKQTKKGTPKKSLLLGTLLLCCAVAAYFYIGNAEKAGHSFELPIVLDPIYRLIGKWGIVAVVALGSVGWFWDAIKKIRQQTQTAIAHEPTSSTSTSKFPPS